LFDESRSEPDGSHCSARRRFHYHLCAGDLARYRIRMRASCHDQCLIHQWFQPIDGLLQQAAPHARQIRQELGCRFP
jgi:hypothetical protein